MSQLPPTAANQEVLVFRKNNFNGQYDSFTGYQEQNDLHDVNWPGTNNNESTDYSSLVVGANVYLTLYSKDNCSGDHVTFYPGSNSDDLSFTNGKNWNNKAKSFSMTSSNPYPSE